MILTPTKLGYGLTPEEACFNFITGNTYYVCPLFTTKSAETIDYSIFEDSGGTITVASGFYSDGNIVRYYNNKDGALIGSLCEAYVCRRSEYLRGCCDNKIYKLKSGKSLPVDSLISIKPVYFCYRVIPEPTVPLRFSILNDDRGYLIYPSSFQCDAAQCQPCPTTTGQTVNDCEPLTLFPLEVKCDVTNPTEAAPYSGVLSAIVIGGTQPYQYIWTFPNGNNIYTQTIYNVGAGVYNLQVVDKYGDFTATTQCELTIYIDCTFSGAVTEFQPTTTTTTTFGPCYCYTIENNWTGDLVTTTTTTSSCPSYCFQNITSTGNGISNVIILTYSDCDGNPTQTLFAMGNIETINTPDISGITLSWVSGTGTPNESVDYVLTNGVCPSMPMLLIGDVIVDYYDCTSGLTSIIITTGITKICSYTIPTVYPTVTGVTITQTGLCQTDPCPTTIPVTTTTTGRCSIWEWNNQGRPTIITYIDCDGIPQQITAGVSTIGTFCVLGGTTPTLNQNLGITITNTYSGCTGAGVSTTTTIPTTTTTTTIPPNSFIGEWIFRNETNYPPNYEISSAITINGTQISTVGHVFPVLSHASGSNVYSPQEEHFLPILTNTGQYFSCVPPTTITVRLYFPTPLASPHSVSYLKLYINNVYQTQIVVPDPYPVTNSFIGTFSNVTIPCNATVKIVYSSVPYVPPTTFNPGGGGI